jgi:hypothetical protein
MIVMVSRPPNFGTKRSSPRFRLKIAAEVVVQSIGSKNPYSFFTENVSGGGVYIKGTQAQYPFRDQSILEVWLVLDVENQTKIFFNGKIVHNREGGFGLKIIQIEDKDQKVLNDFLLEYKNTHPDAVL